MSSHISMSEAASRLARRGVAIRKGERQRVKLYEEFFNRHPEVRKLFEDELRILSEHREAMS